MRQSPPATAAPSTTEDETTVTAPERTDELLGALRDKDCRAILDATSDEALSASELSEACDLPLSTTYRKLETLTDAGFLEERTRIGTSGKHASEYVCPVEDVVVSISGNEGATLQVSWSDERTNTASNRLQAQCD